MIKAAKDTWKGDGGNFILWNSLRSQEHTDQTQQRWKRDRQTSCTPDVAQEKYDRSITSAAVWQEKKKTEIERKKGAWIWSDFWIQLVVYRKYRE